MSGAQPGYAIGGYGAGGSPTNFSNVIGGNPGSQAPFNINSILTPQGANAIGGGANPVGNFENTYSPQPGNPNSGGVFSHGWGQIFINVVFVIVWFIFVMAALKGQNVVEFTQNVVTSGAKAAAEAAA